MQNRQYYLITRTEKAGDVVYFDYHKMNDGFTVTPKNQIRYDGFLVNKLIIIKQSFVEKLLKRKIKRKLELYIQYIINVIDSDEGDDDATGLNEILNELSRYKDIIQYKYQQYLGQEYVQLMTQKIELLEYELKLKTMKSYSYEEEYEKENISRRSK